MYKLVKTVRLTEDNKLVKTYGIINEQEQFEDISVDGESVKRLCKLCNELKLDKIHFKDVVEDFIDGNFYDTPSEKDR